MPSTDPAHSVPLLALTPEEMRRFGYRVIDLLADHFADISQQSPGAKGQPAQFRAVFPSTPQEGPTDPHQLLDFLEREVLPYNLRVDHPRFFGFVPGPNNFMSAMADAIAAGFNIFNGTWLGGSSAAALELTVIEWLRVACGLPAGAGGIFVSGGSVANMTALVAARHAILQDRVEGATVYFSDQTHSSVERALRVIGFAPSQFRRIASDGDFRLPLNELFRAIEVDRAAGFRPFCVIANAGTTNTGAVDPLPELATLTQSQGMWLHADGAYGASAIFCERGQSILQGLELVDSLSLDPHKWLFQSFECGCVLSKDSAHLKQAFQIMPEYLRDVHRGEAEIHPCDYGIQLTRSFRALKVWLSVQTFGLAAFRQAIERGFELAEYAERLLCDAAHCEILSSACMGIVCFRFGIKDARQSQIADEMLRAGYAFLTTTTLRGVAALRLCTINPRTTKEDLCNTVVQLQQIYRQLETAR